MDSKLKKIKGTVITTTDGRRRKAESKLTDVQAAYDQLVGNFIARNSLLNLIQMLDLAIAMAGKSSHDAAQAFGSVSKLAIASGHPDWEGCIHYFYLNQSYNFISP